MTTERAYESQMLPAISIAKANRPPNETKNKTQNDACSLRQCVTLSKERWEPEISAANCLLSTNNWL